MRYIAILVILVFFSACIGVKEPEDTTTTSPTRKRVKTTSTTIKVNVPVRETCSDSIQNQDEMGVDCGGPCEPCPSCYDRIRNQNEIGIDCGGVCKPCNAMCENDSVCGKERWGSYYCSADNTKAYRYWVSYKCVSPGWQNASCRIVKEPRLMDKCHNLETCLVADFYADSDRIEARCVRKNRVCSWIVCK